jgi:dTDP-4-dehydrorhamnose reductase
MVNAARVGKSLKVVSDQIGTPTYTLDLAEAILALVDANATGIYHVTNAGQTNWFEFTQAILEEFHLQAELSPTTAAEWFKIRPNSATRPAYSVLDLEDYTRATGRTMRDWRDALRDYRHAVETFGF